MTPTAGEARGVDMKSASDKCPICNMNEGCSHTMAERKRAQYRQDVDDETAVYRGFYLGISPATQPTAKEGEG